MIAVKGNFEEQELTAAQLDSLIAMPAWGVSEFGVDPSEITGHRNWAATACPGESLYTLIANGKLAAAVAQADGDGPVTLAISCDEGATQLVAAIEAGSAWP